MTGYELSKAVAFLRGWTLDIRPLKYLKPIEWAEITHIAFYEPNTDTVHCWASPSGKEHISCPPFATSLDACMVGPEGLLEYAVARGVYFTSHHSANGDGHRYYSHRGRGDDTWAGQPGSDLKNPARAFCLAFLNAAPWMQGVNVGTK